MPAMQWLLDVILVVLLAATLFHAVRLERALGVLKRDRAELQELIANFNASSRQAEIGIERLRGVAEGAGQQIAHQVDAALALKDDLVLLIDENKQRAENEQGRHDEEDKTEDRADDVAVEDRHRPRTL